MRYTFSSNFKLLNEIYRYKQYKLNININIYTYIIIIKTKNDNVPNQREQNLQLQQNCILD